MNGDLPIFPGKWNVVQIRRKLCGVNGIRIGPFGSALTLDQMVEKGYKVYGQENVISQNFAAGTRFLSDAKYAELKNCSIATGDLLVTMMGTTGRCCVVPENIDEGIMDSHLIRLRFQDHAVDPSFMALLIDKGHYVKDQISAGSKGTIMNGLNSSIVKDIWVGLPDVTVQKRITSYLAEQAAKIDRLIDMRRRQIELLKEQRAAIIQQVVTRGLNHDAPMKDSGISCLGEIPAHWDVKRLGSISSIKARLGWKGLKAEEYVEKGYIFLATPNIKGDKIDFDNVNYITKARYDESPEIMLREGDVLVVKDGATLGIIALVENLPAPATVNGSIAVIRPRENIISSFLVHWFSSHVIQQHIDMMKGGMGVPHLFQSDLRRFPVALPPIEEQEQIASLIENESKKINNIISAYSLQLTLLAEYRASLFHECVTGQRLVNNTSLANGENNEHKSRPEENQ